ncbi:unnamed protein product [Pedinophyceae sp. YPF-701]|nr:unnamed protein product [Pedinophyceae sp. YPF-701]
MECDICLMGFDVDERVPKVLACGHTFCLRCLKAEQGRHSSQRRCPKCRGGHWTAPDSLPTNYIALDRGETCQMPAAMRDTVDAALEVAKEQIRVLIVERGGDVAPETLPGVTTEDADESRIAEILLGIRDVDVDDAGEPTNDDRTAAEDTVLLLDAVQQALRAMAIE